MLIASTRLIKFLTLGSDRVLGLALYPCIILRDDIPDGPLKRGIILHEKIHLRQQLELIILPFYLWYLAEYCAGRLRGRDHYRAVIGISFEREADAHMNDIDYLRTRRFFAFLKYLKKGKCKHRETEAQRKG
jgi:hypothetical protein